MKVAILGAAEVTSGKRGAPGPRDYILKCGQAQAEVKTSRSASWVYEWRACVTFELLTVYGARGIPTHCHVWRLLSSYSRITILTFSLTGSPGSASSNKHRLCQIRLIPPAGLWEVPERPKGQPQVEGRGDKNWGRHCRGYGASNTSEAKPEVSLSLSKHTTCVSAKPHSKFYSSQ